MTEISKRKERGEKILRNNIWKKLKHDENHECSQEDDQALSARTMNKTASKNCLKTMVKN